jgi:hypothetical protein
VASSNWNVATSSQAVRDARRRRSIVE